MTSKCNVPGICGIYRQDEIIALLKIVVYKEIFSVQSMSQTNKSFQLFFLFDMFMSSGTTMLLKMEFYKKMLIVKTNVVEIALLSPVSEFETTRTSFTRAKSKLK